MLRIRKESCALLSYLATFSLIAAIALILGIALVIVEMFIPGFGLPGISGIILIALGIYLQASSVQEAVLLLLCVVAILSIALFVMLFLTGKKRVEKNPIVLHTSINPAPQTDMSYFMGREGTVSTPLRPAGIADFDGVRLDVVAEAEFVEAGQRVRVIRADGNRIVVRHIKT
jgi:membrane-bound ClpP family serine protease